MVLGEGLNNLFCSFEPKAAPVDFEDLERVVLGQEGGEGTAAVHVQEVVTQIDVLDVFGYSCHEDGLDAHAQVRSMTVIDGVGQVELRQALHVRDHLVSEPVVR